MTSAIIKARRGRALWLKLHLFLALSAGFLFALLGLTGSLSIYREEIDELLNPGLVIDNPQEDHQSLDRILAAVKSAHPERHGAWTLEMPRSTQGMITAWFDKPRETYFDYYAPLMVSVNPYTNEVVASRFWGATFTTWLLDIHTQLHLGLIGRNAIGVLGLLLMLSAASGLVLWWPGVKGVIKALTIRRQAGLLRWVTDLHRMIGILSAMALLILAGTGFLLSYPKVMEKLTGAAGMGHGETDRTIISTAVPNNHPLGLEAAVFIARAPFPHAEFKRITTPVGEHGVYEIHFRQESEINQRHPFTTVWVDRWSGHILDVRDPGQFSLRQSAAAWAWPLHSGEALGATGRLAWFLAGQALFFLYLSGLLRWLCRRGVIRDRAVDFTSLKAAGYRTMVVAYHQCLRLGCLAVKALPRLAFLFQSAKRWFSNARN